MRERFEALPRSSRLAAVLMIVVPALLWLFLVWDTRPYSPVEIAADRASAERDPAFDQTVETCALNDFSPTTWEENRFVTHVSTGGHCKEVARSVHSSLTREPLGTDAEAWGVGTWTLVSMATAMLLVGMSWPPPLGAGSLLRQAGRVLGLGTAGAFVVGSTWWWGLDWIAERRGVLETTPPMQFISSGALLAGLIGVVGLAAGALLRSPLRAVATLSTAAILVGAVVLLAHPLEPWLPMLNVEAFLFGDEEYRRAPQVVSCDHLAWPSIHDSPMPGSSSDVCTSARGTRTLGQAALYLLGLTGGLVAAASLTLVRRPGAASPV